MVLARIILGLLALEPMTGYDVMKAFRRSAAHFWHADKAQIYRTLATLVDDGFARTTIVAGTDAPDRIVHHLTDAGRRALVEWLISDPKPHAARDEFTARVFFAEALTPEELEGVLERRRAAAQQGLSALRALEAELPRVDPARDRGAWLRRKTLDYGITTYTAHITWLDELRAGLEPV